MSLLNKTIESIECRDSRAMKEALKYVDNLTKPLGSLGELEKIAIKFAGITGKVNNTVNKKSIVIMCADNGVVDEGVSSCPQETTKTVTENFTKGITGVNVLANFSNAGVTVVDIGVKSNILNDKVIQKKVMYGTENMKKGPAMTREQCIQAIEAGIEVVDNLVAQGYDMLGTGEMGIGNTTTSSAVLSVLSGLSVEIVTGRGAGLTDEQLENKKEVIQEAIRVNNPNPEDPIDVMAKVGGLDIAGLCGCYLGAAKNRVPIVIDGFIAGVAALCAYNLNPKIKDYTFPSHLSAEPGAIHMMKVMGLNPMLNLGMRLGEGSGCPLSFNIIESALYTMNNMGTFQEAKLAEEKYWVDIR